ncbi:alpha-L-rhamnosidase [Kiritimatiellaeota bacterium B1221]|nr:alpha-L-rhamnosidase [Kiritimatiellaeota bacterium B1221]
MDLNAIKAKYNEALEGLAENTKTLFGYEQPVLNEGGRYKGVWLECGPLEGLVYGKYRPAVARANHEIFFHHQREDGYIPAVIKGDRVLCSQIQMVVPIAATALETADLLEDEAFLARAYDACARWDHWLSKHRNTRGTGLCEAFCEYDTGHDNSPRFKDLPRRCPDDDASICPGAGKLPYLAPDLSATVYGGRIALAEMAERLGKPDEAGRWREKGEALRKLILEICYDPEDECFYDVDSDGAYVRIRGDVLTRVLGEHVVDQAMFERIYSRHIKSPEGFWPPYPLPSIAVSDPLFDHTLPINSWGGASQALTALRAPRWFEYYGKTADLKELMGCWVNAILAAPDFMQQMNPWTGAFSTSEGYSPAMCVFVDFVNRLGVLGAEQGTAPDAASRAGEL